MSKERVRWHTIECRYISDGIGEDYKTWETAMRGKQASRVFIESPTGSGKTFFLINTLLPYAIEKDRSIIYICNRDALKQQIIQSIRESSLDLEEYYSPKNQITNFVFPKSHGSFCVVNYQSLANLNRNHPIFEISTAYYIVMDEVHFFLDDALYNEKSDQIFWNILNTYNNMVQLFLSATMLDFWNLYTLTYEMFLPSHPHASFYHETFYNFNMDYYINKYTSPRYNIILYNDDDFLFKRISDSIDEKWLIFTSRVEKGKELRDEIKKFKKCYCITAGSKKTKRWENLIKNNHFDCDVLISTKVIDNGVNLIDDKLKNIVLPFGYPSDFLQMLGRKRFTETSQYVNVYVRRLTVQEIRSRSNNFTQKLLLNSSIMVANSMREKISLIKNYWNNEKESGFDFRYRNNELSLDFNSFAIFKLSLELEFYIFLFSLGNNPKIYFQLIEKWLGNNIKDIENISHKTNLLEFLESQINLPIIDSERFYSDFIELYLVHSYNLVIEKHFQFEDYDDLIRFRQATGRKKATINECLKKLNLHFILKKKNNNWIVTRTD